MKKKLSILLAVIMLISVCDFGKGFLMQAYASGKADATVLNFSENWGSDQYLEGNYDEKWYQINIPATGKYKIKIMSYYHGLEWTLYDKDSQKKIADYSSSYQFNGAQEGNPKTNIYSYILEKGTYYLKTTSYSACHYKLSTTFEDYHTNDHAAISYDSPQDVPMGTQITAAISSLESDDWYRITVPKSGNYVFKIKSYLQSLSWYIYDQDRNQTIESHSGSYVFDGATSSNPVTNIYTVYLSAGTYYLQFLNSYHSDKYIFSWDTLSSKNCPHKEYTTQTVYSTYFSKGYTKHTCKSCGHVYKSDYTSKAKLAKGYIWSYGLTAGRKKFTVSYNSINDVSGYQIRYSTDRKFKKNVKKINVSKKTTSKTIKKLKGHKKYYVQVRGYKKSKKKVAYGSWSDKRSIKTK